MLTFLLVVQAIVAVLLVGVILMQQSEGGGLGMGGSPTGLMSARGAADFLTRATTVLASLFIGLSILHAVLATRVNSGAAIDTTLAKKVAPAAPATAPAVPLANDPSAVQVPVPLGAAGPAPATTSVPLAAAPADKPKAAARVERVQPRRTAPAAAAAAPPPVVSTTAPPASTPAGNAN